VQPTTECCFATVIRIWDIVSEFISNNLCLFICMYKAYSVSMNS